MALPRLNAFPRAVRGPVDFFALARFASSLRCEINFGLTGENGMGKFFSLPSFSLSPVRRLLASWWKASLPSDRHPRGVCGTVTGGYLDGSETVRNRHGQLIGRALPHQKITKDNHNRIIAHSPDSGFFFGFSTDGLDE
jgi:hypothetical protein